MDPRARAAITTATANCTPAKPVIVDIFPTSQASHYCGDCTRTVVHGEIPPEIAEKHSTVRAAKEAACAVIRPGVTGAGSARCDREGNDWARFQYWLSAR